MYSIDSIKSFKVAEQTLEEIKNKKEDKLYSVCLIGNKVDLETTKVVDKNQGQMLANKYNAAFIETSAKDKINTYEWCHELVRRHRNTKSGNITYTENEPNQQNVKCCTIL